MARGPTNGPGYDGAALSGDFVALTIDNVAALEDLLPPMRCEGGRTRGRGRCVAHRMPECAWGPRARGGC